MCKMTLSPDVVYSTITASISDEIMKKQIAPCQVRWLTIQSSKRSIRHATVDKMLEYIKSDFIDSGRIAVNKIENKLNNDDNSNSNSDDSIDCNRYTYTGYEQDGVFSSLKVIQMHQGFDEADLLLPFLKMQLEVFGKVGIVGIGNYTRDAKRYFSTRGQHQSFTKKFEFIVGETNSNRH